MAANSALGAMESTPQISASRDTDKFCLLKGEEILSLPLNAKIVLKLLLGFQKFFGGGIAHLLRIHSWS